MGVSNLRLRFFTPATWLAPWLAAAFSLLAALAPAFAALTQDDLLEPEKAFRISTRALDPQRVEVRFQIADGYYMYRDRFKFETQSGKLLADVELPPGVLKKDEFFGETQTYRREALIRVPVSPEDAGRGRVKLKVTSQGCADSGVCYVPLEQMVDVRLPGATSDATAARLTRIRSFLAQVWVQSLIAAAALALFMLSLQMVPGLARWRGAARATSWFYPALAFAFSALVILSVYPLLVHPLRDFAWGALLVMAAVWLRATDRLPENAGGAARFAKGIGVLALAAGVVLLTFAAGWQGLSVSRSVPVASTQREAPHFERVTNLQELDTRTHGTTRPTLLDFYADWCVTCKEMERFTFSDPAVRERMLGMQLLQVDVTRNTEADKAFLKRFGIFGPPAILFFDPAGNELRELRVIGFQSAERFGPTLDRVLRSNAEGSPR